MDKYQLMPDLSPEDYAALKADIAERGVQVAIEYDEDGNVLDGHHRLRACNELGLTQWPRVVRVGWSEVQKREQARKLNMARRQLTREQRQELIRQQLMDTPEKSDRQIAAGLGVSNSTVSLARKDLTESGQVCESHTSSGADGKQYPRKPITLYNPSETEQVIAKKVIATAAPELVQAVAENKVKVGHAFTVAEAATKEQQVESLRRLNEGEAGLLVEGLNQQKMEEYLKISKEQRQEAEREEAEEDRQEALIRNTNKAFSTICEKILFLRSDYQDIARCLLAYPGRSQEETISYLNECIERLRCIKAAITKPSQNGLRVVK